MANHGWTGERGLGIREQGILVPYEPTWLPFKAGLATAEDRPSPPQSPAPTDSLISSVVPVRTAPVVENVPAALRDYFPIDDGRNSRTIDSPFWHHYPVYTIHCYEFYVGDGDGPPVPDAHVLQGGNHSATACPYSLHRSYLPNMRGKHVRVTACDLQDSGICLLSHLQRLDITVHSLFWSSHHNQPDDTLIVLAACVPELRSLVIDMAYDLCRVASIFVRMCPSLRSVDLRSGGACQSYDGGCSMSASAQRLGVSLALAHKGISLRLRGFCQHCIAAIVFPGVYFEPVERPTGNLRDEAEEPKRTPQLVNVLNARMQRATALRLARPPLPVAIGACPVLTTIELTDVNLPSAFLQALQASQLTELRFSNVFCVLDDDTTKVFATNLEKLQDALAQLPALCTVCLHSSADPTRRSSAEPMRVQWLTRLRSLQRLSVLGPIVTDEPPISIPGLLGIAVDEASMGGLLVPEGQLYLLRYLEMPELSAVPVKPFELKGRVRSSSVILADHVQWSHLVVASLTIATPDVDAVVRHILVCELKSVVLRSYLHVLFHVLIYMQSRATNLRLLELTYAESTVSRDEERQWRQLLEDRTSAAQSMYSLLRSMPFSCIICSNRRCRCRSPVDTTGSMLPVPGDLRPLRRPGSISTLFRTVLERVGHVASLDSDRDFGEPGACRSPAAHEEKYAAISIGFAQRKTRRRTWQRAAGRPALVQRTKAMAFVVITGTCVRVAH